MLVICRGYIGNKGCVCMYIYIYINLFMALNPKRYAPNGFRAESGFKLQRDDFGIYPDSVACVGFCFRWPLRVEGLGV